MILENLHMYRKHNNEFCGSLAFKNNTGEVKLNLGDEACRKILLICAEELVASSKEVAQNLTANIIESTNMITLNSEQKLSSEK